MPWYQTPEGQPWFAKAGYQLERQLIERGAVVIPDDEVAAAVAAWEAGLPFEPGVNVGPGQWVVVSEAEMLALVVPRGDIAIRTDLGARFVAIAADLTVPAAWLAVDDSAAVAALVPTKGDLIVGGVNGPLRHPAGTDGAPLTADSTAPAGIRYADTGWRTLVATSGGLVTSGAFASTDWGPDPANAGSVKIRRTGPLVTVRMLWVRCLVANGAGGIVALVSGFRGGGSTPVASLPIMPGYGPVFLTYSAALQRNQGTTVVGDAFGRYCTQSVSWYTDDVWPAVLPGTPG